MILLQMTDQGVPQETRDGREGGREAGEDRGRREAAVGSVTCSSASSHGRSRACVEPVALCTSAFISRGLWASPRERGTTFRHFWEGGSH